MAGRSSTRLTVVAEITIAVVEMMSTVSLAVVVRIGGRKLFPALWWATSIILRPRLMLCLSFTIAEVVAVPKLTVVGRPPGMWSVAL